MKSAHEICGCLDGVRCALTIDRDRLMGMANSAENRARLAEDRERVAVEKIKQARTSFERIRDLAYRGYDDLTHQMHGVAYRAIELLDAQEPRT